MNKTITFAAFGLMVLVQLYIPSQMIFHNESVLDTGMAYKFKAAPVDPYDPFRGKYINLTFEAISFETADTTSWDHGETVYIELTTDSMGYAKVQAIYKTEPTDYDIYVKANISYTIPDTLTTVYIQYPFERFYMEESKASEAEITYNESVRDTNQVTYALVFVKKGEAVIKDVLINDVSIAEIVKNKNKN